MPDRADLIVQYFNYLTIEYGFYILQKEFTPQVMGNAIAIFKSSMIGIEIVIDRNQVLITVGDQSDPKEKWFEFSDVIEHFAPSENAYVVGEKTDDDTWDDVVETQLHRLAVVLRQYCEPLLRGDFSMKEKIKEIEGRRVAKMLEGFRLSQENYKKYSTEQLR